MVPKNAPTMLHQPRGEHLFDHAVDHVLTMRFRASHGAGEGVLDTSFGASGAQEGALKMLNQPSGERFLIMLFDHQKKALHGAGEAFLASVFAMLEPCAAQEGLLDAPSESSLRL